MVGRPLPIITWFCVGLIVPVALCGMGLWIYGILTVDDEQSATHSPQNVSQTEPQSQSSVRSNPKTPIASDLESLDTYEDDYTRSVALRALLSSADTQRVISLLEQSKEIRSEDRRLTTQVEIFRRFAVIDALEAMKHTFDIAWNRRTPMVEAIFLEWATTDVDAAIAHAKTLGSADRRIALEVILRVQDDWSDDRIMDLALEFGHESIGIEILEQIQIARAFNDPRLAWNAILNDAQKDRSQIVALRTILELWVELEGFDVIFEAMKSIPHIDYPSSILDPIIEPIAQEDPLHALELINEFGENARKDAAFTIVQIWAETDPAAALETVSAFNFRPESTKVRLMQSIGSVWADHAPREAIQSLTEYLSSWSLRPIRGRALRKIVRESPQDAVDILNEIPNGVRELGRELVEEWASVDVSSAFNWIGTQEESLRAMLLREIMPALVEKDPELALNTALNQEIAEGRSGLEYEVIRLLARTDVHRATEMLARVRDHDYTKQRAYVELGFALVSRNEYSAAIELGSDLPENLQDEYFPAIVNGILNRDKVELYEILDLLPKPKYLQEAARRIIWETGFAGRSHQYFTDEQIEEIRAFQ